MNTNNTQKAFMFYLSWFENIAILNDKQKANFLDNLARYYNEEELIFNDPVEKVFWNNIKISLEVNKDKYERKAEANRINGKKGGRPKKGENKTQNNPKNPVGYLDKVDEQRDSEDLEKTQKPTKTNKEERINNKEERINNKEERINNKEERIKKEESIIDNEINSIENKIKNNYPTEGTKNDIVDKFMIEDIIDDIQRINKKDNPNRVEEIFKILEFYQLFLTETISKENWILVKKGKIDQLPLKYRTFNNIKFFNIYRNLVDLYKLINSNDIDNKIYPTEKV